jgi:hypothetical protein
MEQKYKLLLVDIDGTLEGKSGYISRENRKALSEVRTRGVRVSLSTGRVPQACQKIIQRLSLDGCHIFSDGALVSGGLGKEKVFIHPMDDEVVEEVIEFARLRGIYLELYSAEEYFVEQVTEATTIHRQFFDLEPTVLDFATILGQEKIIKAEIIKMRPEEGAEIEDFRQHFERRLWFSPVRVPQCPNVEFINIVNPEVSKAKALEALATHLGISRDEVVAVGDGANDISLLSSAGLGVAMGSAPPEVKAVADYVTLDAEHHGLSHAIKKFLL